MDQVMIQSAINVIQHWSVNNIMPLSLEKCFALHCGVNNWICVTLCYFYLHLFYFNVRGENRYPTAVYACKHCRGKRRKAKASITTASGDELINKGYKKNYWLRRKWRGAPDVAHLAWRYWRGAPGVAHLAWRKWRGASVAAQLAVALMVTPPAIGSIA